MEYHFDSDFLVALLRERGGPLAGWASRFETESAIVSEMVHAELLVGCLKSPNPDYNRQRVMELLSTFRLAPFAGEAVEHYADIRYELEREGTPIGPNDLVIAATARAAGATLVSGNVREFRRVPDLILRDWRAEA